MRTLIKQLFAVSLALPIMTLWAVDFGPARKPGDLTAAMESGEFPAGDLFEAMQKGDVVRMRRHMWNVFAGLTSQDTVEVKAPIFLSWYTKANLFDTHGEDNGRFGLQVPKQVLDANADAMKLFGDKVLTTATALVLGKVYFNAKAFQYIVNNRLNVASHRTELNCAFRPEAAAEDRHIPSFPVDSVAIKTIWRVASATNASKLTALPVWDPESNSPQPDGNNPDKTFYPRGEWSRYVAVNTNPTAHVGEDYAEIPSLSGQVQRAPIVPLSRFFNIKIHANMIDAAAALLGPNVPVPRAGDYLILVGMHVTTKEIPNWVWATYWWHDRPDAGPFAAQRPTAVRGAWRNYLMNVSYDMDSPREADGSPHVNFNPYLEASKAGGVKSNCMTCHRLAASPQLALDPTPGAISIGDPRFDRRIKLDFLWSLSDPGDATSCPAP